MTIETRPIPNSDQITKEKEDIENLFSNESMQQHCNEISMLFENQKPVTSESTENQTPVKNQLTFF